MLHFYITIEGHFIMILINILFCKDYFFVYPDMGLGSLKGLVICGDHIGLPDLSCCLHIVLCVSHTCVYFISFDK